MISNDDDEVFVPEADLNPEDEDTGKEEEPGIHFDGEEPSDKAPVGIDDPNEEDPGVPVPEKIKAPSPEETVVSDDNDPELEGQDQKITLDRPMHSEGDGDIDKDYAISMPSRIDPSKVKEIKSASEKERNWDTIRVAGYELQASGGVYAGALNHGDWKQKVDLGGTPGRLRRGKFEKDPSRKINDSDIALRIKSNMGTGGTIQVPLLSSCIWVTLNPAPEKDLLLLFNTLIQHKVTLGRDSFGAVLTNMNALTYTTVFEFITRYITHHSVDKTTPDWNKLIRKSDITVLLWAFVYSMYPEGHPYTRACDNSPNACFATRTGVLNIADMLVIDDSAINPLVRAFMGRTNGEKASVKEILEHQEIAIADTRKSIKINSEDGSFTFDLYDPPCGDYFDDAKRWVNNNHNMVIQALGKEGEPDTINNLMRSLANAADLLKYTHMFTKVTGSFGFTDTPRGVYNALEALSSDSAFKEKVIEAVEDYTSNTARYVVGIDNYDCSECGKPQGDHDSYMIPIDVLASFFTMGGVRVLLL